MFFMIFLVLQFTDFLQLFCSDFLREPFSDTNAVLAGEAFVNSVRDGFVDRDTQVSWVG